MAAKASISNTVALSIIGILLAACGTTPTERETARGMVAGGAPQVEEIYPGYTWRRLDDGLYSHSRTDPFEGPVDGNSVVIINEDDVFIVDTHINPAATRALVSKIKTLTDNPVTHVINTHWHDDHVNGNDTIKAAFPDVTILAHPATVDKLRAEWPGMIKSRINAYAAVSVEQLMSAADALDTENPDRAISYRVYAGYVGALKPEMTDLRFAYPDKLVDNSMTFVRGEREIVVRWAGRGNTDGDLVVWLPQDSTLITGDIVVAPVPYAFSSPMLEWPDTLQQLTSLEPDRVVPGHGEPQESTRYMQQLAVLIEATIDGVRKAAENGVAYADLEGAVDLSTEREAFTQNDPRAVNAWNNYYVTPGIDSTWKALGYPEPEEE